MYSSFSGSEIIFVGKKKHAQLLVVSNEKSIVVIALHHGCFFVQDVINFSIWQGYFSFWPYLDIISIHFRCIVLCF